MEEPLLTDDENSVDVYSEVESINKDDIMDIEELNKFASIRQKQGNSYIKLNSNIKKQYQIYF